MNVLITSDAGFIGSHLAEKPLEKGYGVKVPHNLSSGFIENLYRITGEVKTVEGNYKNHRDLPNWIKDVKAVHLVTNLKESGSRK